MSVWLLAATALEPSAAKMAGILAAVILLWITESVPLAIPGIVGTAFAASIGIVPVRDAFGPLADRILLLFIGSFLLAHAVEKHGLSQRIAYGALSLNIVGGSPRRVFWTISAVSFLLSAWVSNTATCAMMLPIAVGIITRIRAGKGNPAARDFAFALAFTCTFSASIGGLMTPVGTPPNLIGLAQLERVAGITVTFPHWFATVSPPAIAIWILGMLVLERSFLKSPEKLELHPAYAREKFNELGPMGSGERWTLAMLLCTVSAWVIPPGIVAAGLGGKEFGESLTRLLPEAFVPLFFTFPLFAASSRRDSQGFRLPVLDARDFGSLDWNTIFLYGGGLCIGALIDKSGLASVISTGFARLPVSSPLLILLAGVTLAAIMSEFASNTASANIIAPILAVAAGAFDIPADHLMLAATAACTLGFLLPVSTPLNAMIYATGEVPLRRMIRYGLVMDIIGIVVLTAWFRLMM